MKYDVTLRVKLTIEAKSLDDVHTILHNIRVGIEHAEPGVTTQDEFWQDIEIEEAK